MAAGMWLGARVWALFKELVYEFDRLFVALLVATADRDKVLVMRGEKIFNLLGVLLSLGGND